MLSDYLESGLALVPVPIGKKGPVLKAWNHRENVVVGGMDVGQLENMNVGIAHAYCTPTPTCAIDIDNCKQANRWLDARGIDLRSALLDQVAVVISSGKPNSLKVLYRLPQQLSALQTTQVVCDDGSMMLEFRCASRNGKTVQDLVPPSLHPSGSQYRWMGKGDPTQIPEIPTSLLVIWQQLIVDCEASSHRRPDTPVVYDRTATQTEVANIRVMLGFISADCDYFRWRDIVWALLSTGWACAIELAKDWSKTASEKYDDAAFSSLVDSYDRRHENRHTIGTIVHYARIGGWGG